VVKDWGKKGVSIAQFVPLRMILALHYSRMTYDFPKVKDENGVLTFSSLMLKHQDKFKEWNG
jgi:hypothetical protein